ncbi:MAG: hypothetical protein JNJ54_23160 [Myxococcaceae bacterium]|nr:hypothetical protein [Myxococcaceae bacterium]
MPFRPGRADVLALLALLAAFVGGVWLFSERTPADPDRHFHWAIARTWAEHGPPKTLPQVEGIGWNVEYVDKEFLFHAVTWLGWVLGGKPGVVVASAALGAVVVLLLFLLARRFIDPAPAAVIVAAVTACPMFLYRLALVRPHLLAIAATLLLLLGLLERSWKVTAAAGLVFALAYHALYVPLAVLGLGALVLGRGCWRAVAAGVAGLVVGTVVNPYFPGTLETTWMTLTIAASKPAGNTFGGELFPLQPAELLGNYRVPALLFVASVVLAVRSRARPDARTRLLPVAVAGLFWALCFRSARASEYAIPLTVAAFAPGAAQLPRRWLVGAVVVVGLSNAPLLRDSAQVTQLDRYTLHIADAVLALPKEAAGQKVLNCTFTEGELMLDLRPDVRFVDVLDPTYLERFDQQRHLARLSLLDGSVADVKALVTETFGAKYVMCGYPPARRLLDEHPGFVRLRPPPGPPLPPGNGPYLYEVRAH